MTLAERLAEATQKFDQLDKQRDQSLKQAEECLVEMNKLQGEYRLLEELIAEELKQAADAGKDQSEDQTVGEAI